MVKGVKRMETKEKNNILMIVVIVLLIVVIGLGGYLVYDKILSKDTPINTDNDNNNTENNNNDTNNNTDNSTNSEICNLSVKTFDSLSNVKKTYNMEAFEISELNNKELYIRVISDSKYSDCYNEFVKNKYYKIHTITSEIKDVTYFPFATATNGFYFLYSDGTIEEFKFTSEKTMLIEIKKLGLTNIEKFQKDTSPGCESGECGNDASVYAIDKNAKKHLLYEYSV